VIPAGAAGTFIPGPSTTGYDRLNGFRYSVTIVEGPVGCGTARTVLRAFISERTISTDRRLRHALRGPRSGTRGSSTGPLLRHETRGERAVVNGGERRGFFCCAPTGGWEREYPSIARPQEL
jgi:hypothetical protein